LVNDRTQRPTRERRRWEARGFPPADRARLTGCALTAAVVAAPFCALLYGWNVALAVMSAALTATAYLAQNAARTADPTMRRRLRTAVFVNALLALGCVVALVARLT
jgi:hypothetical protein